MRAADTRTVVLDDDPTGTQAATDVPVVFGDALDGLAPELRRERCIYVQTNSRSLGEQAAVELAQRVRTVALGATRALGTGLRFVLRGDSTLRGHVFAESGVFMDHDAVLLFVPAFPDGGRQTRDGVHRVRRGEELVAVAETEFAHDPVFSYGTSDLLEFTRQRSGRDAQLVPLAGVRERRVSEVLVGAPAGSVVLADAETEDDIRLIARSVEQAWTRRPVVVRSAASLAAELGGVRSTRLLRPAELHLARPALVVCGSHTDGARLQLERLAGEIGPPTVVDTEHALADPVAAGTAAAVTEQTVRRRHGARFVATERDRSARHAALADGARVMAALVVAARALTPGAGVVVTKGGITSADVIRHGLGATEARVLGQLQAGISVWRLTADDGSRLRCVIVPGNMGDPDVLRRIVVACG